VYQLASDSFAVDKTKLFIQTCTSMMATPENVHLVRSATSLVRSALRGADTQALRDFVQRTAQWCGDIDDVLAAAGQSVVDEMEQLSRVDLHDVVRRVAQIERDALASGARRDVQANLRTAYAG
jgi:hypothetical protein